MMTKPCAFIDKFAAAAALLLATAQVASAQVVLTQNITLSRGWNAVYLEVSPDAPPDEVFASWPVSKIGFYDPASFLATRQFGEGVRRDGLSQTPVATWYRDYPEATDVERIPAGSVALLFNTNDTSTAVSLTGVPAAPRMTWHVTETDDVYNFVGFSLQHGAKVLPADYFGGFDGEILKGGFYRLAGNDEEVSPTAVKLQSTKQVSDGDVLVAYSSSQSDWAGAIHVYPMDGVDFGTDSVKRTLSIRNDGGSERTVAVELLLPTHVGRVGRWGDIDLPDAAIKVRDADVTHTNATWHAALEEASRLVASKRLGEGETWKIEFGLDRSKLAAAAKGATFGSLLRITDVDGGSMMRVDVPLVGAASGADAARTAWPAGLWVADVAFDSILAPGAAAETKTGGHAKIRLPIHLDSHGDIRLLQRIVAAGTTDSDGNLAYHLYAGSAQVPSTATVAMRISAVTLPTETPVIVAESGGTFSAGVSFPFTVAGDGATSLLRHPLHPQHDGLRWDFSTPTPSGDNYANYKGDVKPETFSVSCRIELTLDLNGGEAAWNPEGVKTGTCRWTFSNLMRQGDITISGPMTIKRVSPLAEIVLE